jgi:ubiquinone/menaquinone biosynthesis C-methylase UbiE
MLGCSLQHIQERMIFPRLLAGTILELGPGNFWKGPAWLKQKSELEWIGAGYTAEEQANIREYAKTHQLTRRIKFLAGSIENLVLPEFSADMVFSFGAWQAWKQPLKIMRQIVRVLKPGGDIILGNANPEAKPWQSWWAICQGAEYKHLYQSRKRFLTRQHLHAAFLQTELPKVAVLNKGADLWALVLS